MNDWWYTPLVPCSWVMGVGGKVSGVIGNPVRGRTSGEITQTPRESIKSPVIA